MNNASVENIKWKQLLIFAGFLAKSATFSLKAFITMVNRKWCVLFHFFLILATYVMHSAHCCAVAPTNSQNQTVVTMLWCRLPGCSVNEVCISVGGTLSSVCSCVHNPTLLPIIPNKSLLLPNCQIFQIFNVKYLDSFLTNIFFFLMTKRGSNVKYINKINKCGYEWKM